MMVPGPSCLRISRSPTQSKSVGFAIGCGRTSLRGPSLGFDSADMAVPRFPKRPWQGFPAPARSLRMATHPAGPEIERLIQLLAKLPGLGPRSARRAALALLKKREALLEPLGAAMREAAAAIRVCDTCGNLDTTNPCALCRDPQRDPASSLCRRGCRRSLGAGTRGYLPRQISRARRRAQRARRHHAGTAERRLAAQARGRGRGRSDPRRQRHRRGPDHRALSRWTCSRPPA